jgi:hypothetical protein
VNTKTLALVVIVVLIAGAGLYFFTQPKNLKPLTDATSGTPKEVVPSKTFIDYNDPTGFSFSYPDNLSISNTASGDMDAAVDPNAYADLQLFSKDKSGSLSLRIADTKLKTLDEWLKDNGIPETTIPEEKKLDDLRAFEVKTEDRLMLAALDQGVLFTIESPRIEEPFWGEVYNQVLTGFTFTPPEVVDKQASAASSGEDVIFEGEEVIE